MKPVDSRTTTATPAGDRQNALANTQIVTLPFVKGVAGHPVQSTISRRRSIRSFSPHELTWTEIGQLLWAAQGISKSRDGLRVAPSAGALYPLELDVVIPAGVFRYRAQEHSLAPRSAEDIRWAVSQAADGQTWLADAPCLLSFAAVMSRTATKYGPRASRYVWLETGHAAQNILLMATALGLGGTPVGAFDDGALARTLGLERSAAPLYIVAVGWPLE